MSATETQMPTKEQLRAEWVAALRSGEFEQGETFLKAGGRYCCLGVACELLANRGIVTPMLQPMGTVAFDAPEYAASLPPAALNALGIRNSLGMFDGGNLSRLNDLGRPFSEIADIIESKPKGLFIDD